MDWTGGRQPRPDLPTDWESSLGQDWGQRLGLGWMVALVAQLPDEPHRLLLLPQASTVRMRL